MDDIETKLMDRRAEALKDEIDALKKKTEQNRQMARDAGETADAVLNNTTDTQTVRLLTHTHRLQTHTQTTTSLYDNSVFTDCVQQDLDNVTKLFELLKQKNENETDQSGAGERLKNITEEVERMKRQVEDKLRQIKGSINTR